MDDKRRCRSLALRRAFFHSRARQMTQAASCAERMLTDTDVPLQNPMRADLKSY